MQLLCDILRHSFTASRLLSEIMLLYLPILTKCNKYRYLDLRILPITMSAG